MQVEPDPEDAAMSLLLLRCVQDDLAACHAVISLRKHCDATVHEVFDCGEAELFDGAVEVDPFAFHYDVSLVHAPRSLSGGVRRRALMPNKGN